MLDRLRREPAVLVALIGAVIALAVSFGLDWSTDQVGAVTAVVSIVVGLVIRANVMPMVTVRQREATPTEAGAADADTVINAPESTLAGSAAGTVADLTAGAPDLPSPSLELEERVARPEERPGRQKGTHRPPAK